MEKITTIVDYLTEIEEIGEVVSERGPVDAVARERAAISRLLSNYRKMSSEQLQQQKKKQSTTQPTPTPTPAQTTPSISSSSSDPLLVIQSLKNFRTFLNQKLADMNTSEDTAEDLCSWDKACHRVIQTATAFATGRAVKTEEKLENLNRTREELDARGREFLAKRRNGSIKLPFFAVPAINRRKRELNESVDYLFDSQKMMKKSSSDDELYYVVTPLRLRSYYGMRTGFEGLPDLPPPPPPRHSYVNSSVSSSGYLLREPRGSVSLTNNDNTSNHNKANE